MKASLPEIMDLSIVNYPLLLCTRRWLVYR